MVDVVLDVVEEAVVDPTATRQTLPLTPALLHAAVSLTNKRYSVAEAPTLTVDRQHNPNRSLLREIGCCLTVKDIMNLLVTKYNDALKYRIFDTSSLLRGRVKDRNLSTNKKRGA